jgi:hypothetical protein
MRIVNALTRERDRSPTRIVNPLTDASAQGRRQHVDERGRQSSPIGEQRVDGRSAARRETDNGCHARTAIAHAA